MIRLDCSAVGSSLVRHVKLDCLRNGVSIRYIAQQDYRCGMGASIKSVHENEGVFILDWISVKNTRL